MDFATIAAATLATLSPFLLKGSEEIAKGIGKDLWELVKKPFQKKGNVKLLEGLQAAPQNEKLQGKVEGKLETYLEEDPAFAQELAAFLGRPELQQAAKQITLINVRNAVVDSDIKAGGDIIIGGRKNSDQKAG